VHIKHTIDETRGFCASKPRFVASTPPSESLLSRLPPKPVIFYGRDKEVTDIVNGMCRADDHAGPCIAILGPGGIGKTTLAVATMEHPTVIEKFGHNRFCVPCDGATSDSALLDHLAGSLQIKETTSDRLHDIMSKLKTLSDPTVLLLDNLDTPWDLPGRRKEVENIICRIAEVSHVTILVTMRSYCPPSDGIEWMRLGWCSLPGLELNAARQLYTHIHPEAALDGSLDQLLTTLGGMPLVITLLAQLGRDSGDLPAQLLQVWNKGTDIADSAIDLSIKSNRMGANPDARTLLAILSCVPGGVQRDMVDRLAPSISNKSEALATLARLALAEHRSCTRSYHVQPVIRSYMLRNYPLNPALRGHVCNAFYHFVLERRSDPGHKNFYIHTQDISREEENIQAILMEPSEEGYSEDALKAMVSFSWYQFWTRPRAELIDHTVTAARTARNDQIVADALRCQGLIYHQLGRYDDASEALTRAEGVFRAHKEPLVAALCLLELARVYRCRKCNNESLELSEQALKEFQNLHSARGVAESQMQLGELYRVKGDFEKARETLEIARRDLLRLEIWISAAQCLLFLSEVYLDQGCYKTAEQHLQTVQDEYKCLAYPVGAARCLTLLGIIQVAATNYTEALETFERGLDEHRKAGTPSNIAECLQGLGFVYQKQARGDEAIAKFEEARQLYQSVDSFHSTRYAAECLEGLGNSYYLKSHYDKAQEMLKDAGSEYRNLGWDQDRDRCLRRVSQIQDYVQTSGRRESIDLKVLLLNRLL
jgi:tetratricopeptide (TPR) repeat protein